MARVIIAATEPVAGSGPSGEGPVTSGLVAMNRAPLADQPDRPGDRLERVGAGLAEDDVVGVGVGEGVADLVQRGGQPGLADDVGRAAGQLGRQEVRRRQRRGPDRLLGHVQARRGPAGRRGRAA